MSERTILIVEDEPTLGEMLAFNLQRQGFRTVVERDGLAAQKRFDREAPNLVLLDVSLPGLDGFEVCRRIRSRSNVPILILTARGEEVDRVLGLEIGADDYLTKPFSIRELEARVRALLRRAEVTPELPADGALISGDLRLSIHERRLWRGNEELQLRPREFALLAFLIRNRGLALSRQQILDGAWESSFTGDPRTVDVHMKALRDIIESDPKLPKRIVTVRGIGYRFEG